MHAHFIIIVYFVTFPELASKFCFMPVNRQTLYYCTQMKVYYKIMTVICYDILLRNCRLPGYFHLPFIIPRALILDIFHSVSVC